MTDTVIDVFVVLTDGSKKTTRIRHNDLTRLLAEELAWLPCVVGDFDPLIPSSTYFNVDNIAYVHVIT